VEHREPRPPRLIAIFGSGETSPAMTSVHKELTGRVGNPRPNAVLLDTPFGFQPNADDLVARITDYFRQHVGLEIRLASLRHNGRATAPELEQFLARLSEANYVFAGPGSPTYAVRHWRDIGVRERLVEKVALGGCVAFASAAAIGLGAYALPVYEIYKVGDDPSWMPGLDVLAQIGVRCAVIPHYNNQEGGTHDTRFCYMGEARLRLLESMLPDDLLILGVDEYTACIIDIEAQSVTVRGRGGVTVRRRGSERVWKRTTFSLSELQDGLRLDRLVPTIVEMEGVLRERFADLASAAEQERVQMRGSIAPLVELLLSLRDEARRQRRFNDADRIRAILAECGVAVQDTLSGTAWALTPA
jgi:cyanophycinase-like exopeptidase